MLEDAVTEAMPAINKVMAMSYSNISFTTIHMNRVRYLYLKRFAFCNGRINREANTAHIFGRHLYSKKQDFSMLFRLNCISILTTTWHIVKTFFFNRMQCWSLLAIS